jgi:hypothetical protein
MSKRSLSVAVFAFVLGLAGTVLAEEPAKAPAAPAAECPHMKAMREAQEQGKAGAQEPGKAGGCPHMKDGKPCDCPCCKGMKDSKDGAACPHMKDGKPCDCPHHKAAEGAKEDKPGKQPAKAMKSAGKKGAKAAPEGEAKPAKE